MKLPNVNIIDVMRDRQIFAPWFKNTDTWRAWVAFLKALFGLRMDSAEVEAFKRFTGRQNPPVEPATEGWLICGRRSGKSYIAALVAVFLACFRDYTPHLAPGERATIVVLAADRKQARVIFRYLRALLETPLLADLIERETAEEIELSNRVNLEVHTSSFRSVRGYTIAAALCDEIAFWESDGANPDREILEALRPAMATIPGSVLLGLSSPYSRRGTLWEAYKENFGQDGPVLVWQAETRAMNPTVPQHVIDRAYKRDSASANAEYGAQFRSDVEAFLPKETVEACIAAEIRERPPVQGVTYSGFVDPSGGSQDSMTLAIGHEEYGKSILDCVRERKPPFSPDAVVKEFAAVLKAYGLHEARGDRYGGQWPAEKFEEYGISYKPSEKTKNEIYREFLPLVSAQQAELLDNERLINQLCSLERRTSRGGRDTVDHPPRGRDDLANAVAGVLVNVCRSEPISLEDFIFPEETDTEEIFTTWASSKDGETKPWDRP